MNEHTETVLDYTHIKHDLQSYTVTPVGHALAAQLHPLTELEALIHQLREPSEMVELLAAGEEPPLTPEVDLHPHLAMVSIRGFYLEPPQLLEVAEALESIQRLRRYAQMKTHRAVLVNRRCTRLADFGLLLRQIRSALDDQGHVRDHASPTLLGVRQTLRRLREHVQQRLHETLRVYGSVVQDAIVTIRNGRFVIPLKVDFRRALRGIVHGESASGATLYVEPENAVDPNNQLLRAQSEEERAVRQVLRDLTERVAVQRVALEQALQIMGEIDLVLAKGRLSVGMHGAAPRLTTDAHLQLVAARHPLLREPVPVDVHVGPESRTLVITGPNTGGKTAILKTVGLLVLMAQSGLHIPASAESLLPIFTEVFVDVGDEQNLSQNLSTFSAHLANICTLMQRLSPRSLVLLDELGAGTDPMEGGPLGVALLEYFHQSGATTLVTTHHSTIKTFAMSTPQIACAAVAFDLDTLQPRYRLAYGLPGRSQAFAIAKKLGMPASIVMRAQHETGLTRIRSEQLLARLERQQQELEVEQQRVQQERVSAARLREEAQQQLERVQAEEHRVRQALYSEGQELLKTVRTGLDTTLADLRRRVPATQRLDFPQQAWDQAVRAVASLAGEQPQTRPPSEPLQVGEQVRVRQLNIVGRLLNEVTAHGNVRVAVGNKTITVAAVELERVAEPTPAPPLEPSGRSQFRRSQHSASSEALSPVLRLLGSTVTEALPTVEQYLDRACAQGIPRVRIIHGIGSGRLRGAITELLHRHPLVRRFHAGDVGGGTTIVELEG